MSVEKETITTKIWFEEEEPDNPFAAKTSYCSGYDVYGELLGKISWSEYIYLLLKLENPQAWQADLLEAIAIAIANPGPRDLSVRGAMNGGVGGSTAASCLMAALAPGAGKNGYLQFDALSVNWVHPCVVDGNLGIEPRIECSERTHTKFLVLAHHIANAFHAFVGVDAALPYKTIRMIF